MTATGGQAPNIQEKVELYLRSTVPQAWTARRVLRKELTSNDPSDTRDPDELVALEIDPVKETALQFDIVLGSFFVADLIHWEDPPLERIMPVIEEVVYGGAGIYSGAYDKSYVIIGRDHQQVAAQKRHRVWPLVGPLHVFEPWIDPASPEPVFRWPRVSERDRITRTVIQPPRCLGTTR